MISGIELKVNAKGKKTNPLLMDGVYLNRFLPFCKKIHAFQGAVDPQTLFEDALELRNACKKNETPLASFNAYSGLTHGFSMYTGYKNWRYTIGPMDEQVIRDISKQAMKDLQRTYHVR